MITIRRRLSFSGVRFAASASKYKFFEDMYPTHEPSKRYDFYEDQVDAASVKSHEKRAPPLPESEKLQRLHSSWKEDKEGMTPPAEYGWSEDWGPEPGEDGHNDWYSKGRMYMSFEEKAKYDLKNGVPLSKNEFRHQELPATRKMRHAYEKMSNENPPDLFPTTKKNYTGNYSREDKRDIMAARDEYMQEWLDKPGVSPDNLAKKIGDYNGTASKQNVVPVVRKPEWELAPLPETS